MSSKGKFAHPCPFRARILAIAVLCGSLSWVSANALAQDAPSAPPGSNKALSSSALKEIGSKTDPFLIIGMVDRSDTSGLKSFPMPADVARDSSNTPSEHRDPAFYMNRTAGDTSPLVLSSLANFRAK